MAVDIEELIIAPFREVVKYGKEAVANAEAVADNGGDISQRMAKAGKAVLREGERALKRLQPLWDDQVEKHGDAFKASMNKNGASELAALSLCPALTPRGSRDRGQATEA